MKKMPSFKTPSKTQTLETVENYDSIQTTWGNENAGIELPTYQRMNVMSRNSTPNGSFIQNSIRCAKTPMKVNIE